MIDQEAMMNLIFVYNANSGFINAMLHAGHKLISPSTYSCNLCTLTHNTFIEDPKWAHFKEASDINMMFYHLNEFEMQFPEKRFDYPVVLKEYKGELQVVMSAQEINEIKSVDELISHLNLGHMDNLQSNLEY